MQGRSVRTRVVIGAIFGIRWWMGWKRFQGRKMVNFRSGMQMDGGGGGVVR